ncbi:MAG: sulfurtransferase [Planctomycetaceae bacterium]|nr:sulfurtransferase [Planctomycetaceae bacterium]
MSVAELAIVNIAAYKFVELDRLTERREQVRELGRKLELKGTVLLSEEGINLFIAGSREAIDKFLAELRSDAQLSDLVVKESLSERQPFTRMLVKIKNEIISFGVDGIDPRQRTSPKLPPEQLKQWLDEGRPVHLLDTRNDYEVEVGTFRNAHVLGIDHFREFPEAIDSLPASMKDEPIVMFCTGGIRCEKAGPFMQARGFKNVFQLDGGILKYFEECGGDHYDGDCFVFDQRVAVDPQLRETAVEQCFACQMPLTVKDQSLPSYEPGVSCRYCYQSPEEKQRELLMERRAAIHRVTDPLPGSIPYDNRRPLNVPERFAGRTLIDFLSEWHPQIERETWLQKILDGHLLRVKKTSEERVSPEVIVLPGERYEHLIPATIEPSVNADIEVLHEDDCLVIINKPAPLPMHACGRFNRNTLQYILNEVYKDKYLRMAHRLDASTSGVAVFCQTRDVARFVHPQFENREVKKVYVARVMGLPQDDEFSCSAAISAEPGEDGLRTIADDGLTSETHFTTLERFADGTALVEARPVTGRTNQIRAHLWHLGLPICGDPVYLSEGKLGTGQTPSVDDPPLCLHSRSIRLVHPESKVPVTFEAPLPNWAVG